VGDYEQGYWLLEGLRLSVHVELGFGSFLEYGDRLFGYGQRMVAERLRVAQALRGLPVTSESLRAGEFSWSAVRELTRVVTNETESEWVQATRGKTVRQVEQMVSGRKPGDRPCDPPDDRVKRHWLRFEVSAETLAIWRQAIGELTRRVGSSLSDDEQLLAMAVAVLGGPNEGRASHQIALTVCERCGGGWQESRGQRVAIGAEVVEMAGCDAQVIGRVDGFGAEGVDVGDTEDRSGEHDGESDGDDGDEATYDGGTSDGSQRDGGSSDEMPHVGHEHDQSNCGGEDDDNDIARPPFKRLKNRSTKRQRTSAINPRRKAKQSIPPAVRREVLRRYGGKCAVDGCQCSDFLNLHHLRYRADGTCKAEDLIPLCPVHHRRVHGGYLIIEGDPDSGFRFYHADGRKYGTAFLESSGHTVDHKTRRPAKARAPTWVAGELIASARSALRSLGFGNEEVQNALRQLEPKLTSGDTHVGKEDALGNVIRQALAMLAP